MLETLSMQFGSAGSAHPLPEGQGVDAVVGDNQPIRILVKKI
jgi:isoleucyl-tRNA synthetase